MKRWVRRRLSAKFLLPFSGLAILLSTLWLTNSAVSRKGRDNLQTQFVVTGEVFRGLMSERARRLTADTVLLAADFALKRAIATYDPGTLATVAVNYRERIDLELLWITDESGNLLGDASGRRRAGRAIGNLPPLHDAITEGREVAALSELDGRLFVFVAVPVLAPDPIGFLLAGSAIDDSTARALEEQIGSAVTFATASRVFATSLPAAEKAAFFPGGRLGAEALRHGDEGTFLMRRGDERLLSLLVPIESSLSTPLFALLQQSNDHPFRHQALVAAPAPDAPVVLEQVAGAAMSAVEGDGVARQHATQQRGQRYGSSAQEEVEVIRHQRPRIESGVGPTQ